MDNEALYEKPEHWGRLKHDELFLKKVDIILGMIPSDVNSILDAGCGDGALTNILSKKYDVTALDRSKEALKHVDGCKVLGDLSSLPFPASDFDLVICSEVLEHLPEDKYRQAVAELERVTKKYIFIGVPYQENLLRHMTRCCQCDYIYHLWGHQRRYSSIKDVKCLYPKFKVISYRLCGRRKCLNNIILWIKRYMGNEWACSSLAVCPMCGSEEHFNEIYANKYIKYVTDRMLWQSGEKTSFRWQLVLLGK